MPDMKTLTIGGTTYTIVDETARTERSTVTNMTNSGTGVVSAGDITDGSGNILANKADSSSNVANKYIIVGDWRIMFGSETMNSSSASGSGTFTAPYYDDINVTFSSAFSATPYIYLQLQGGWTGSRWVTPHDPSTTGFKIRMYSSHKNSTSTTIRWLAIGRA